MATEAHHIAPAGGEVVDEFIAANAKYAASFDKGDLALPPARKVAVVVCMDARIDPAKALGLQEGDAHVIRNAGGRAQEALRSLIISEQLLGTQAVVVIHHTDCGMLTFSNDDLHGILKTKFGEDTDIDFLPFSDLKQSVRDDVAIIRNSPFIPSKIPIQGFVYDVQTGKLEEVH